MSDFVKGQKVVWGSHLYRVEKGNHHGVVEVADFHAADGAGESRKVRADVLRLATAAEVQSGVVHEAKAKTQVIFFDMDDTLADFESHYEKTTGRTFQDVHDNDGVEAAWKPINDGGFQWWASMPPLPHAKRLWKLAGDRAAILSSPGQDRGGHARRGKRLWLAKHFKLTGAVQKEVGSGWNGSRIVLLGDKAGILKNIPKAERKNYVLVDDNKGHIAKWKQMGGTAIHFRSGPQAAAAIKKLNGVNESLDEATASGWTVAEKAPLKRGSLEKGTAPVFGLRDRSKTYGTHRTRAEAMASVIDMQMPEVKNKPWAAKKRHWPYMTKQMGYVIVRSKGGKADIPKDQLVETLDEAAVPTEWYHGDPRKRTSFVGQKMDRDRTRSDANANGPGIYWTTDTTEARGYAGPSGYVHTATIKVSPSRLLKPTTRPTKAKLKKLMLAAPKTGLETGLSNWGYDPGYSSKDDALAAAIEAYEDERELLDAAVAIQHDFYADAPDAWTEAMVKLGYDAYLVKDRPHLVVYNPKIIRNIKATPYRDITEAQEKPWRVSFLRYGNESMKGLAFYATKAKAEKAAAGLKKVKHVTDIKVEKVEESKIPPQFRSKLDNPAAKRKRKEPTMDEAKQVTAADVKRIGRVDYAKVQKKYPTFARQEDLSHGRGQGKRVGKMVMGGMATVGLKATIRDYGKQFGISGEDLKELELMSGDARGQMMIQAYAKARYAGYSHGKAAAYAFMVVDKEPAQDIADAMNANESVDEAYEGGDAFAKYLVPNKSVLINDMWYTITKRSLTNDTVELDNTRYAKTNAVKPGKKKSMSFSGLVKAIKKGKIGASIGQKYYGPKQDKEARNKRRKKAGLSALPGMAKENLDRIARLTEAKARTVNFRKLADEIDQTIVGQRLKGANTRPKTLMAWIEDGDPLYLADGGMSRVYLVWSSGDYPVATLGSESTGAAKKAWNSTKGKALQKKLAKLIKSAYDAAATECVEAVAMFEPDLCEVESKGKPDKTTLRLLASMDANKAWPAKAEDGKAYVVLWADGRGIAAFKTKAAVRKMAEENGSWSEFVWIRYQEPEHKGKKLKLRESGETVTGEQAVLYLTFNDMHKTLNHGQPMPFKDDPGTPKLEAEEPDDDEEPDDGDDDDDAPDQGGGDGDDSGGAAGSAGGDGGDGAEEPDPDAEEKAAQKEKRKEDGYHKGDIQDHYDMLIVQGVPQHTALTRTKRKFKLKDLRISPAGRILTKDDVAEKPKTVNPMLPPAGGEEGDAA